MIEDRVAKNCSYPAVLPEVLNSVDFLLSPADTRFLGPLCQGTLSVSGGVALRGPFLANVQMGPLPGGTATEKLVGGAPPVRGSDTCAA